MLHRAAQRIEAPPTHAVHLSIGHLHRCESGRQDPWDLQVLIRKSDLALRCRRLVSLALPLTSHPQWSKKLRPKSSTTTGFSVSKSLKLMCRRASVFPVPATLILPKAPRIPIPASSDSNDVAWTSTSPLPGPTLARLLCVTSKMSSFGNPDSVDGYSSRPCREKHSHHHHRHRRHQYSQRPQSSCAQTPKLPVSQEESRSHPSHQKTQITATTFPSGASPARLQETSSLHHLHRKALWNAAIGVRFKGQPMETPLFLQRV